MSEITIDSKFKEYYVRFVDDFTIPLADEIDKNAFIIVDLNVFNVYKSRLSGILKEDHYLVVEAHETTKTLESCQTVIETLVAKKVRRNQKLIAIGGGVIQDVTAFVASILYRGIEWVFFPTTLLAQADSCIGSKTSINLGDKKNLIGNFYPPSGIFIDTGFLESLTPDDVKSGIGEMLHFYFYADSPFTNELIRQYDQILGNRGLLRDFIRESLAIKKSVIEIDEFDKGERNKFNYGHTFGHALETLTNYGIKHGQAITVGMDMANYLSMRISMLPPEQFDVMHLKLAVNFPCYDFRSCSMKTFFEALSNDKKNIGNNLGCILSEGPGKLIRHQIPFGTDLQNMIIDYFKEYLFHK